jgi:DNA-binding CsgD family transcriptional regulator
VTHVRHDVHTLSAVYPPAASGRRQMPQSVDSADRRDALLVGGAGPAIRTFAGLTIHPLRASTPGRESVEPGGPVNPAGDNGAGTADAGVTNEELTILTLLASGLTLDSVAVRIAVSQRTLSRRLRCVCDRLGVAHPIQAIVWAARRGLI